MLDTKKYQILSSKEYQVLPTSYDESQRLLCTILYYSVLSVSNTIELCLFFKQKWGGFTLIAKG